MAFRIRQRATGEIEVEMDTASEVQTLLEVVRAQRGFALPLLAAPPGAEASPNGHRPRRAVRAVGRRRRRQAVEAPPVSPGAVDVAALLKLLARGPSQPAELARALRQHRHKVTAALKQLERERRAHSTGATIA
jgi:hypothetical protein